MATKEQLYDQAIALKEQGDFDQAAEKLREVIELDASYGLAHSALAVVLQKLGRHEEAIQHAQKVCQLEPNDPFSYTALSVTLQRAGRIPEAEEALARAHMIQQSR